MNPVAPVITTFWGIHVSGPAQVNELADRLGVVGLILA